MVAYRSRIRDVTAVIVLLLFMCHQTTTTAAAATAQQAEQQQQGDRIERDVDEDEIKQAAQVTIGNLNNILPKQSTD